MISRYLKADFHSIEFSDWTGNPLSMCENVTMNLNRMLRAGPSEAGGGWGGASAPPQ